MTRIGIVGVGLLGTAVAQRLLDAGFEVCGYDTRPEQLDALRGRGLKPAASVRETAVGRDAIVLRDELGLRVALLDEDLIALEGPGAQPGSYFVVTDQ